MPAQNVAVKVVATPLLIGAASLTGRRFGHHVGGWLVALPMTSGPVAFFLATDHGVSLASRAALGMLAGTTSQVAFALAYASTAVRGAGRAFLAGSAAFAAATVAFSFLHWPAPETFALVLASLVLGYAAMKRRTPAPLTEADRLPRWDIPVRMAAATTVVLLITTLAPLLGAHLAGLLSPFPVFGAVLAVFTHRTHGPRGATQTLEGRPRPRRAGRLLRGALDDACHHRSPGVRRCNRRGARGTRRQRVRDPPRWGCLRLVAEWRRSYRDLSGRGGAVRAVRVSG